MEKASCCDHPRICQKTIKKYKTVSPEPLFQTGYFNRCLSEQLHTQNYGRLEQSTIRCNSDTNHGLLQGRCVEASDTVICIHVLPSPLMALWNNISLAAFRLVSSVCHFKSCMILATVPGSLLYVDITDRPDLLWTISRLFMCLYAKNLCKIRLLKGNLI
jgi:hypothetical protein